MKSRLVEMDDEGGPGVGPDGLRGGLGMPGGTTKVDNATGRGIAEALATVSHETGHAVLFHALGGKVDYVSTIPNWRQRRSGVCAMDQHWEHPWGQDEARVLSILAGIEAERDVYPDATLNGHDEHAARVLAEWEIWRLRSVAGQGINRDGVSQMPDIGRDEIADYLRNQAAKVGTLLKLEDPPVRQARVLVEDELFHRDCIRGWRKFAEICESVGLKAGCLFQVLTPPPGVNPPRPVVGPDPVSLVRAEQGSCGDDGWS